MKSNFERHLSGLAGELAPVMLEHRYLVWLIGIYTVAALVVALLISAPIILAELLMGFTTTLLLGFAFALCGYAIYVMIFIRPHQLTRFLVSGVQRYMTRARVLNALPVLFLLPIFVLGFTVVKSAIPYMHPYAWDSRLAAWDITLHGGVHPWVWLQYALGYPWLTFIINISYHLWFFVMYGIIFWLAFDLSNPKLRMQFLLSFLVSWILLGNVVATIFSSVGPCYYGFLQQGENPYSPLLAYLQDTHKYVPVWALDVQKMLWDAFQDKSKVPTFGISALPSMHVATAVLLALLGWRINRAAGMSLSLFAVLIMIGSVHLGWHYALDGYVGAAGAYAIWRAVGWTLSQPNKQTASKASFVNPQVPYLT